MSVPPPSYEPAPPLPPLAPAVVPYRPLDGRLRALQLVFVLVAGVSVAAVIGDLLELSLMNRLIGGEDVAQADIDGNDDRQAAIGWLQTWALIIGAIAFIPWLYRAYQNTDAVAPGTRRYGHGWAIGGWFVPFLNLWRPKQVVNDVWSAVGDPAGESRLLVSWWTAWIATNLLSNLAGRAVLGSDTNEEIRHGTYLYIVADTVDVTAAILAIVVATTLTRRLNAQAAAPPVRSS